MTPRVSALLAPLGDGPFRRLVLGRTISYLGDWLLVAGLVGWVYARTGSTAHVAGLMLVRLVPPVVGGGLAGVVADRLPRQRLLVAGELLCGTAVAGALAGVLLDSEPVVFACVAACALLSPIGVVSMNAIVPDLVPEPRRTSSNAALQIGQELAMASGALAAGLTLDHGSATIALALDLASFAVAAALFARIPRTPAAVAKRGERGLAAGFRHIASRPVLLAVACSFAGVTLATGLTNATLPRFLSGLGLGPGGYGLGLGTLAAGSAVGEALLGAVAVPVGLRTLGAAAAVSCLPFAWLALASGGAEAIAALGALGVVQGIGEVALVSVVQREAGAAFRGRAFGLVSTIIRTTMLSAVAAAPLVNRLGSPRDAILASTAITAVAAAAALLRSGVRAPVAAAPASA